MVHILLGKAYIENSISSFKIEYLIKNKTKTKINLSLEKHVCEGRRRLESIRKTLTSQNDSVFRKCVGIFESFFRALAFRDQYTLWWLQYSLLDEAPLHQQ